LPKKLYSILPIVLLLSLLSVFAFVPVNARPNGDVTVLYKGLPGRSPFYQIYVIGEWYYPEITEYYGVKKAYMVLSYSVDGVIVQYPDYDKDGKVLRVENIRMGFLTITIYEADPSETVTGSPIYYSSEDPGVWGGKLTEETYLGGPFKVTQKQHMRYECTPDHPLWKRPWYDPSFELEYIWIVHEPVYIHERWFIRGGDWADPFIYHYFSH